MSVPANIERMLESYKVPYDLASIDSLQSNHHQSTIVALKPQGAATGKILKASDGQLFMVVHALDEVMDINAVGEQLKQQLQPLAGQELENFMAKCDANLKTMPALPIVNDIPTLVDKGLYDKDSVYLDIGINNQFVRMEQSYFKQIFDHATVASISKPIVKVDLTITAEDDCKSIENSVSFFTERRIKQRLEDTLEFPPLPLTASKIIQLRVNPDADISDLVDIVELDASLSAQVVSWAASPYYSAPGAIKSIHDAIVRVLGFDMVLNLALGLSLGKTMKMPKDGPNGCLPYWLQSVYVATAAEAIVKCIARDKRPSFGTAYLSGLLHNFGYLIISEVFNNYFKSLCDHIDANPQVSVQSVERHVLGVDRDQLSAWLMASWGMPEPVVTALRFQSINEYDGDDWQYPTILNLAKRLLQKHGIPTGSEQTAIPNELYERLGLDKNEVDEAMVQLLAANEELEAMAKQMG